MDVLKEGSGGPEVELLQAGLKRAKFYPYAIDGLFGPLTKSEVIKFQRAYGLEPDGVVGPLTWKELMPFLTGYVVRSIRTGDTFYSLAAQYGSSVRAIRTANPALDPQNLKVGGLITVPLGFSVVFTNISYTSEVLRLNVEGLKARYPFLVTGGIGRSIRGIELYYIKIGTGSKEVFYNASHHANEWITTPVLMAFAEQYAAAYAGGYNIFNVPAADIYRSASVYLAPMVNPDGVDLVTGYIAPGSVYYGSAKTIASNYPNIPFPLGWKANIAGVDLNVNYPAGWENAKRIKTAEGYTKPGPRDFPGDAPLSEPESRAMVRFTGEHGFGLTLSYHTQGETIYWKYLNYEPAGSREIADEFGEVSGYTVEETPYESGFAGYKDWFIQSYNKPGYTIEAGMGVNPLPISQFDRIYSDNIGILTLGAVL